MLVMMLAQARIFLAMARDGLLPPWFARIHPRFKTLSTGTLVTGISAAIIGGLVSYPLTAVAAIVVGIVEAFSSFYASNFKEVIVFTLILPVLVLRSLAAPAVEEEKD